MSQAEAIRSAVESVVEPEINLTLGDLGFVRDVDFTNGVVTAMIAVPSPGSSASAAVRSAVETAAADAGGVSAVNVAFEAISEEEAAALSSRLRGPNAAAREIALASPGSGTRVIGISSGKGGVGKSSLTANLAVTLARAGKRVGIIDADVWGFSIPKMMGVEHPPNVLDDLLLPPIAYGVSVISMDYFVQPDQAVVWRGPMLHKALEQFLVDVHWGSPDYLLIDMPPGTGDVAISISQYLPRSEIVVVTTPQPTAQRVAVRAGLMARKVNQDIIGVVENMSWFTGDDGKRYEIFGSGGGEALAAELDVPMLGQIPLVPALREGADHGRPIVVTEPESEAARAFGVVADGILARGPRIRSHPELVIS